MLPNNIFAEYSDRHLRWLLKQYRSGLKVKRGPLTKIADRWRELKAICKREMYKRGLVTSIKIKRCNLKQT